MWCLTPSEKHRMEAFRRLILPSPSRIGMLMKPLIRSGSNDSTTLDMPNGSLAMTTIFSCSLLRS